MKQSFFSLIISAATLLLLTIMTTACTQSEKSETPSENPQVTFKTTNGDFTIELYSDKAPETVKNFLAYAEQGFYEGTIFHRVIKKFVIQGGGFDTKMGKKETRSPIKNEANNGLLNEVGTVAMARTDDPHSASSQFFINLSDNNFLDHKDEKSARTWGYCVFGKVIKGMEGVKKMGQVETKTVAPFRDVPAKPIIVKEVLLKQ